MEAVLIRNLTVEGCKNARDLGGYPTADGRSTRWQVLVRAGDMSNVSSQGQLRLADYGIKTIVDLRDESELKDTPNGWVQATEIRYRHLPMMGDAVWQTESWQLARDSHQHLHEHYTFYLEQCQSQIGAIVGAVIDHMPGTLFHCFMGKDRTGLIAGLLLGAVGVPDAVIVDDYALTTEHFAAVIPDWRVKAVERGEESARFDRDVASEPFTMVETLGVRAYLAACGVSEAQLGMLRERFVE
jgi:protein-tyrosine phosphatase